MLKRSIKARRRAIIYNMKMKRKGSMFDEIVKWLASTVCIIGAFVNALGYQPTGLILIIIGGILWLVVGIILKEMSIIVTNVAIITVTIVGLLISISAPFIQAYLG